MDAQSHIGATTSGGNTDLIHHQIARNHGLSSHPTNEQASAAHEHARNAPNRTTGSELGGVYQEGRHAPPAVRFQVPRSEGPTATNDASRYTQNYHSSSQDRLTASTSTMPQPQTPPRGSLPSVLEHEQEGGQSLKRVEEGIAHQKEGVEVVAEKPSKPLPQPELDLEQGRESRALQDHEVDQGKESRIQREYGELPRRRDTTDTSSDRDSSPTSPRERQRRPGSSRMPSGATTILLDAPLPSLPRDDRVDSVQGLRRPRTRETNSTLYSNRPLPPSRQHSDIDWIVPVDPDEKSSYSRARRKLTVGERLQPTLDMARQSRQKFATRARYTKYIQNTAIGLQVILGSLTTGLSAVATTGRQMAIQTTILGGLTTIVASYLAKTRNSDEPELSRTRVNDLDKFLRTGTSFLLDFGHSDDPIHDKTVEDMRNEFEELLGNGTIEKNPAPPAV